MIGQHGDVEKLISEEGNELLRRLLEGHFDLRSSREAKRGDVRGSDGVARTRCREECERTLMSLFGEVVLKRKGYAVWAPARHGRRAAILLDDGLADVRL